MMHACNLRDENEAELLPGRGLQVVPTMYKGGWSNGWEQRSNEDNVLRGMAGIAYPFLLHRRKVRTQQSIIKQSLS